MKCLVVSGNSTVSKSPSPRRAWIEMMISEFKKFASGVALPTEGVD